MGEWANAVSNELLLVPRFITAYGRTVACVQARCRAPPKAEAASRPGPNEGTGAGGRELAAVRVVSDETRFSSFNNACSKRKSIHYKCGVQAAYVARALPSTVAYNVM